MRRQRNCGHRRAFTLVEMLVVILMILILAALAAAFMPRVQDSTNLSSGIDQLEQWLLTAKMRAKRDGMATGIRFIVDPNNTNFFSQFQYIQQPDPISGGWFTTSTAPVAAGFSNPAPPPLSPTLYINGALLLQTPNTGAVPSYPCEPTLNPKLPGLTNGMAQIYNFDASLGGVSTTQYLVQPGDYLEVFDRGVYYINTVQVEYTTTQAPVAPWQYPWPQANVGVTTLALGGTTYDTSLSITAPTTNFRILRQPRPIIGENPLQMPGNIAVDTNIVPNSSPQFTFSHVNTGVSGQIDILFSPSGAVVGPNAALSKIFLYIHDLTQNPVNPDLSGIVGVQTSTGFIGAYNSGPLSSQANMYLYANEGRGSGL